MTDAPLPRLIYFADTMCSWCYGFAPEMNRVMLAMGERVDLILQAGGLRPFHTEVLTEADTVSYTHLTLPTIYSV